MAKMFYTQPEAAARLGKTPDELKRMVREGRLREFMDNGPVYRVEDINKMAAEQPAPAGQADAVDLELADEPAAANKEDTVITSAGVSIFDDEELAAETDPMAQTQVTPSVEDQISLEGSGSGSGLLDLTREADDTSLGAELLEEIYPTAPTIEAAEVAHAALASAQAVETPSFAPPTVIEAADSQAAAFTGVTLVGLLTAAFMGLAITAIAFDMWPSFLQSLADGSNPYYFGAAMAAIAVVFWVVGMVVGKSTSGPRM